MDPVSRAQLEPQNRPLRGKDTRFKPGQSGNPGGRPKKLRITRLFEKMLAKPENRKEIEHVIKDILNKRGMASVLLLREMTERTEGKVSQELEISGSLTTLSDEALAAKLAKLLEK